MAVVRGVLCLLLCLGVGYALYEDQIGDVDWYQQHVGPVSYITFDQSVQGSKRLLVASESGVLAAINTRTGNITWRQVFEPGQSIDAVVHSKLALITVSGGGSLLRSWDSATGALKWEVPTNLGTSENQHHYPLDVSWRPGAVQATITGKTRGSVVVMVGSQLASFDTRTGDKEWTNEITDSDSVVPCAIFSTDSVVYTMLVSEQPQLIVASYNISNGELKTKQLFPAPWLSLETTSCLVTEHHIVCLEGTRLDLYHTPRDAGKQFALVMLPTIGISRTSPGESPASLQLSRTGNVWVQLGDTSWLLDLQDDVSMATKVENTLHLEVVVPDSASVVKVLLRYGGDGGEGGRVVEVVWEGSGVEELSGQVQLEENRGKPLKAAVHLFSKQDGSLGCRIAMVMEDHTLLMLQQSNRIAWQREEALATIVALEMLDLPAGQSESTENFVTLTKSEGNPLKLAMLRLQIQVMLAKEFISALLDKGLPALLQQTDSTVLVRDQFDTRKLLLAAAHNGKLYGLDSNSGKGVWQDFLPWLGPFQGGRLVLHVLRSTSHPPHPPLAVAVGNSKLPSCPGSVLHAFNPLTGHPMSSEPVCLPRVLQTMLLPTVDHTHSKILLLLTHDLKVHTFPFSPEVSSLLSSLPEKLFFFAANTTSGDIQGFHVVSGPSLPFSASPLWHLHFPTDSEVITSIVPKPPNELVSSQGRVLADRSVQYKYLNPHLIAVVTESTDPSKPFVTVYLVDSVTGGVVHHTSHKQAAGPVYLVHSENWIMYHLFNAKLRRHELAVLEMYETSSNQTHSVWSSLVPPPSPEVTGQAYTFPTSLSTLTTTHTLRGITHKSILLGLHSGHIAALPKDVFDPRRVIEMTNEMREEGLPPYVPEMAVKPGTFINYNRTVTRLRKIYTSPSGLESTCLVMACGLDLFFTRVTPSKQFDLLAEDFDYRLVAAVVAGMVVGTVVLSWLAARKTLRTLWK